MQLKYSFEGIRKNEVGFYALYHDGIMIDWFRDRRDAEEKYKKLKGEGEYRNEQKKNYSLV